MGLTIHQEECRKLDQKLRRLEARRLSGKSAAEFVPVEVERLEMLLEDHRELEKLLAANPEKRYL